MVVLLWWCFGGVFVVVFSGGVFVVVFLWCGVVLEWCFLWWWCFCGGVV